jgi:putative flippase GtrA
MDTMVTRMGRASIRNRIKFYPETRLSVFKGSANKTSMQLLRYAFVGGLAFLVDFGTLFILTEYVHVHYLVSAAIAFIFGLTVNYILSVKWVFNIRTVGNRWLEFLLFALIGLVGLGLNELFLWIITEILAIYYLISKIITTIIVYFWNFFDRKYLLFNNK